MEFNADFLPLFIVLVLAYLSPLITSQVRGVNIPSVVMEIIIGIVIGPHVLNLLPHAEYMEFLGLMGFIFLMFLSGLEIDVSRVINSLPRRKLTLTRYLTNPLLVGITIYVGTLMLAVLGAMFLSFFVTINHIWYFALIISTTSVGIIMPVLKHRSETKQHFGQMLILAAAVADILSILLFTFTTTLIRKGPRFEVLLILSLFLAFIVLYWIGKYIRNFRIFKKLQYRLSHSASQIKVRGALAMILLFLIVSQLIDAEVILGGFLAGILLSYFINKDRSSLLLKLDGMGYGFFIPIFFIMVGSKIDLSVFADSNKLIFFLAALFIILYVIKIIPSLIWYRLFGWKKAISGGLLLSSRLSLIIAASQIGLNLGVITPAMNTSFVILALVTCFVSPVLYNNLNRRRELHEDKTIIIGGGGAGVFLARNLWMHDKNSVIIEQNYEKVESLSKKGFNIIHGNGANASIYKLINLEPHNYIVILTNSEERNLKIANILKERLKHHNIITFASKKERLQKLKNLGIDYLDGSQVIAIAIENLIFRPTTYHAMFESFESYRVETMAITNKEVANSQVKEIPFHQEGFLMLIRRDGELIVPHGDDYLKLDDEAVVFGNNSALLDFEQKFTGKKS